MMSKAIVLILMIMVVVVPLYFDNTLFSCFDLSKISVLYWLVFVASGLWCVETLRASHRTVGSVERQAFKLPRLGLPVLAIVLTTGLSTILSISPYTSLVGTYKRYSGLVSCAVYVLIFFLVTRFVSRKRVQDFVTLIILTASIASVYGIIQAVGFDPYTWNTKFGLGHRVPSSLGNPAFHGCFMAVCVPLALSRIWHKPYIYGFVLFLLVFALYQTKSRAGFVGCGLSCILFFAITGKSIWKSYKVHVLILAVLFIGMTAYFNVGREYSVFKRFFIEPFQKTEQGIRLHGSALERLVQFRAVVKIIADYPWLGIGPDTLGFIYPRYCEVVEYGGFENQNRVHCELLDIMVASGIIGLLAFLSLIFAYSWHILRCRDRSFEFIGIVCAVFAYFTQGFFSFGHIPVIMLFWVLLGLSVVMCSESSN